MELEEQTVRDKVGMHLRKDPSMVKIRVGWATARWESARGSEETKEG